eukprot:CFRG0745T1
MMFGASQVIRSQHIPPRRIPSAEPNTDEKGRETESFKQPPTITEANTSMVGLSSPPHPNTELSDSIRFKDIEDDEFRRLRAKLFSEGRKQRRRSSDTKFPQGDHIGTKDIGAVMKMMAKSGDERIIFADIILKINKRNKMQSRILLVTENAISNIEPNGYKLRRRIPFALVSSIELSQQSDNFFVLKVREEYDYLLVSSKKVELITRVAQAYQERMKKPLQVNFSDNFEYNVDSETVRDIMFSRTEAGGVSTQIVASSKKKGKK